MISGISYGTYLIFGKRTRSCLSTDPSISSGA
jgi:hypothetical protein